MSTTEPGAKHEPLAHEGERVEADTQLGTVEDRVERITLDASFPGPKYVYHLESGLQVYDEALE